MKEYTKQLDNDSRAFDKQPRAVRQAPISDILRKYNNGMTKAVVQYKSIDGGDILYDKYKENRVMPNIGNNHAIQRMRIVEAKTNTPQPFLFMGNNRVKDLIDYTFRQNAGNFRTDQNIIGQPLSPPERLSFARSIIARVVTLLNSLDVYSNRYYFLPDYNDDVQAISTYITGRDVPITREEMVIFRRRLAAIHQNPISISGQNGRFIGVLNKWHLHIEIGTGSHLTFNTNHSSKHPLNTLEDLIAAAAAVFPVNDNGGPECYAWIRSEFILMAGHDLPSNIRR